MLWGHERLALLLDTYQHSLQSGGYSYIIFLMALESSVVPIPSEVIIPPAVWIVMAGNSTMTLPGIVTAAVVGSWLGATVMYWASRAAGRPLVVRYGRLVLATPEKVERAERWAERFGSIGIFFSRMLPVVRHLIGIPAGIVRMNYLKYTLYTLLGSLVWCTILALIARWAGHDERLMRGEIREVTIWVGAAVVALGAVYYFFVHRLSRDPA